MIDALLALGFGFIVFLLSECAKLFVRKLLKSAVKDDGLGVGDIDNSDTELDLLSAYLEFWVIILIVLAVMWVLGSAAIWLASVALQK